MQQLKKEEFLSLLDRFANLSEIDGGNPFKVRAYEKAVFALRQSADVSLEDIASGAKKVAGVGSGIQSLIHHFLRTGQIEELNTLEKKYPAQVQELFNLKGLGPKKVRQLMEELSISSIGELEYACRENRLIGLKGFGEKIQSNVLQAIHEKRQYAGLKRRDQLINEIHLILDEGNKHNLALCAVGQWARFNEIIDQLEFLILQPPDAKNGNDVLWLKEFAKSVSIQCSEKIKIEEHLDLNTIHRSVRGFELNGLPVIFWIGRKVSDESQAMDRLLLNLPEEVRLEYINKKNLIMHCLDWSPAWLERETIHTLKKYGVNHTYRQGVNGSVRGIFHCHTSASDGVHSLREMVAAAQNKGYEYIGISDHSQSAFYAHGLSSEKVQEQKKEIDDLQKHFRIKIFFGIESDILADGSLDYEKSLLQEFDFVIGSIHSRFQMSKEQMTHRILKALENPFMTIWGHPSGRLLLSRKPYEVDWEACFLKAQEHQVTIELNANPQRLDIDWRFGLTLREIQNPVCINPDAHHVEELEHTVNYGEPLAEKAALASSQILNLKSVGEMESFLWERKQKAMNAS